MSSCIYISIIIYSQYVCIIVVFFAGVCSYQSTVHSYKRVNIIHLVMGRAEGEEGRGILRLARLALLAFWSPIMIMCMTPLPMQSSDS